MKNAAPQGNRQVIKQGLDLTPQSLERGYQAYSGIRDEEAVKSLVEKEWNNRYDSDVEIQKSAVPVPAQSDIRVPTHEEFAALGNGIDGWRALEELGQRAMHGSVQ